VTELSAQPPPDPLRFVAHEIESDSEWLELGNEFASVLVRRVRTRNGARLEICSPKRELSIFLDPTILDGLTWQSADSMSQLLERPLEPLARRPYD
jgi:hypothetical protein